MSGLNPHLRHLYISLLIFCLKFCPEQEIRFVQSLPNIEYNYSIKKCAVYVYESRMQLMGGCTVLCTQCCENAFKNQRMHKSELDMKLIHECVRNLASALLLSIIPRCHRGKAIGRCYNKQCVVFF